MQRARSEQFEALGPQAGAIVFLGDSITEGGLWQEWFAEDECSNRGIGGEVTLQMLARLPAAIDQPRAVFFLGGTNDLAAGESVVSVAGRVTLIVARILRIAPGCPIFLQSVMPRKAAFARQIVELNALIAEIARRRPTVAYVDLWPALATPAGALRADCTFDNLHLNGAGYSAWAKVLRPIIEQLP